MDYDFKMEKQINSDKILLSLSPFYPSQTLRGSYMILLQHALTNVMLGMCHPGLPLSSNWCKMLPLISLLELVSEITSPLSLPLHWLKVKFRIDFKILLFVFKALNGLAPAYITDLLKLHAPSRSLRSANQSLLVVPKTRLKSRGDRAFFCTALWSKSLFLKCSRNKV